MQNDSFPTMQPIVQPKKRSWIVPATLGLLLVASLIFATWAYMSMLDYKNNSDKKSAEAVLEAENTLRKKLDLEFTEKEKSPFETFAAIDKLASLALSYPKTWELYVDTKISGATSSLDAYAHPGYVPGVASDTAFALRFQVTTKDFESEKKTLDASVKSGTVKSEPFRPEKMPETIGVKYIGEVTNKRTGVLYLFPTRDKSIKIWTESNSYTADLDSIMKTLTFAP